MCVCKRKNSLQENIYLDEIADTKSKDFLEKKFENFFSKCQKSKLAIPYFTPFIY
jgi:hypothetical protein